MTNSVKRNPYLLISIPAILHFIITFFTDKTVFSNIFGDGITDYVVCKLICLVVLYYFYYGLYCIFLSKDNHEKALRDILITAIPYLIVIAGVLFIKLPGGYISNDETLIYEAAVGLEHYTWFYYITTYYYIVSLMIIPTYFGPVFMKAIIELLVVGYVVNRIKKHFGKPIGYFGYILFLLYPVIAYTASAHRLPVYYLLYLLLMCKFTFDALEKILPSKHSIFWMLTLIAILTQWRTEGIYLAVCGIILLFIAYPSLRNRKAASIVILVSIVIQYFVSVPQNGLVARNMNAAADDRMKPFYAYTITNMMRNGLDREKNADDLAIVDRYLSTEVIDAINEYYEDINYEDVLILYQPGYIGTREEATYEDFANYVAALKRIFKNNPDILLKTRAGAFVYSALPFHITYEGGGASGLVKCLISIVKTVSYNLFIPLAVIILLCLYSLIKRKWLTFFMSGGLIAHWFIVFILAPASYFKYYFPVYIMAYFFVIIGILILIQRHRETSSSGSTRKLP